MNISVLFITNLLLLLIELVNGLKVPDIRNDNGLVDKIKDWVSQRKVDNTLTDVLRIRLNTFASLEDRQPKLYISCLTADERHRIAFLYNENLEIDNDAPANMIATIRELFIKKLEVIASEVLIDQCTTVFKDNLTQLNELFANYITALCNILRSWIKAKTYYEFWKKVESFIERRLQYIFRAAINIDEESDMYYAAAFIFTRNTFDSNLCLLKTYYDPVAAELSVIEMLLGETRSQAFLYAFWENLRETYKLELEAHQESIFELARANHNKYPFASIESAVTFLATIYRSFQYKTNIRVESTMAEFWSVWYAKSLPKDQKATAVFAAQASPLSYLSREFRFQKKSTNVSINRPRITVPSSLVRASEPQHEESSRVELISETAPSIPPLSLPPARLSVADAKKLRKNQPT